ncbi:catalase [Saccharomonospora amisosensis]|uniref:Catalase n=1 Tax=Saccharomonospora amisosensis TaxID=1128677 RepID=A0A7X5UL59_9PSEU|nr:hypothetical protein [Saccharomonospora amisosensis]NIJ10010.1 catalase [Saccharomonospora amisosensis]
MLNRGPRSYFAEIEQASCESSDRVFADADADADAQRECLAGSITGHTKKGVREPMLERVFEHRPNLDKAFGK